jgi:uncharacterized protein YutE (UPF0331/DUF86 family)
VDERTERRLVEKAEYVGEAVTLLAGKRDELSFDEYRADREQRDIVEREFETAIEACLDIGKMILRAEGDDVPETNAQVFRELGTRSVIDQEIAERMAQAAGFRNILSHRYGNEINDRDVYNFLQEELPLFRAYLQQIREFVE